ncbi:MAG: nitronate monooxygenase [Armatimonadota bacterium]
MVVGGMGVDVSTPDLALAIAELGGIAHLSDAMLPAVVDRHYGTSFVQTKRNFSRENARAENPVDPFDLTELRRAIEHYVGETMNRKRGSGGIFLNVMEKLTMGNARATLQMRLAAAMDAGIDGLTMGAGLHMGSLELIKDHPRFHDVKLGIIVSSARALKIFLHRAVRAGRLPDYIIVEGPLAGGHLGFPCNWQDFDLATIVTEVMQLLEKDGLRIPVIPAGGIFTGADALAFMDMGAAAVQVATRFAVTRESGLPDLVKQAFFAAQPEDVEVNMISPAGYPMRMLKSSPAIGTNVPPRCDAFGYGLDETGACPYSIRYALGEDAGYDKICLCVMMLGYKVWTCGHTVSRLKETSILLPDGTYQLPTAEEVFLDYQRGGDQPMQTRQLAAAAAGTLNK